MPASYDLVCLAHLRWDFVRQRPQHLLNRCARERRVFFVEEPSFGDGPARLDVRRDAEGVTVVRPLLPTGLDPDEIIAAQRRLLDLLLVEQEIQRYVLWYYTPTAVSFSRHLEPLATVYDVMDELSAFALAPRALRAHEAELLERADVVFTGGQSLYEAKKGRHPRVHLFPSSVDVEHFCKGREPQPDPLDQRALPRPRLGFFGVLDERLDRDLIAGLAEARPNWQIVMIGPTAKIDPADLPRRPNIHYFGPKVYAELPMYLAGWDVALLPFALNEATRFISPTKTPEYLAAGKAVVSTPIRDVVRPYGEHGLVRIAETIERFVEACDAALAEDATARFARVDPFLSQMSWARTWSQMARLIDEAVAAREWVVATASEPALAVAAGVGAGTPGGEGERR